MHHDRHRHHQAEAHDDGGKAAWWRSRRCLQLRDGDIERRMAAARAGAGEMLHHGRKQQHRHGQQRCNRQIARNRQSANRRQPGQQGSERDQHQPRQCRAAGAGQRGSGIRRPSAPAAGARRAASLAGIQAPRQATAVPISTKPPAAAAAARTPQRARSTHDCPGRPPDGAVSARPTAHPAVRRVSIRPAPIAAPSPSNAQRNCRRVTPRGRSRPRLVRRASTAERLGGEHHRTRRSAAPPAPAR